MNHPVHNSHIVLFGGLTLFFVLVLLFTLDLDSAGKATARTSVNITNSSPVNCSVMAGPGLNTISFPCISTAKGLPTVINGTGVWAVYQYVPGSPDLWRVHNPNLPNYVIMDLTTLSRRIGYVLIMNATSREFNSTGVPPTYTDVPFVAGWSLGGYPSNQTLTAPAAFAGINASITQVQTYNNSAGAYEIYNNPGGTLTHTIPGQGYWINGTVAGSWRVYS